MAQPKLEETEWHGRTIPHSEHKGETVKALGTLAQQAEAIISRERLLRLARCAAEQGVDWPEFTFAVNTALFEYGKYTDNTFPARAWID